jgi:hypothetical protein
MRWFKRKKNTAVTTTDFSDSSYGGSDGKLRDLSISEYPSLADFERKDLVRFIDCFSCETNFDG